jgi:hypothetical protein
MRPEIMEPKRTKRTARPLLVAGAGIAVAIVANCGGSSDGTPVVGNLKPATYCDAGECLPDGGQVRLDCVCAIDGGTDGGT